MIAEIAKFAEVKEYSPNAVVFKKGEDGAAFYIIAQGEIKIHIEQKIIAVLKEGNIFGELSALSPEPRTADATATKKTILLSLTQNAINHIIDEQIKVTKGIIRILCKRIKNTIDKKTVDLSKSKTEDVSIEKEKITQPDFPDSTPDGNRLTAIEKILILKSVSIFNKLPDNILNDIADISKEQQLAPGQILFNKGDSGTTMYIIIDGEVKVYDGENIIAILGSRKIIGELAALSSESRTASISALKKTRLLKITQESLYEIMWDHSEVAKACMQVLIERLRNLIK